MRPEPVFFEKRFEESGITGMVFKNRKDPLPMTARNADRRRTPLTGRWWLCAWPRSGAGCEADWNGLPKGWKGGAVPSPGSLQEGWGSGGFSLVELIIAIALVAIVTAISLPAFNRYSANADLKTAARAVAADLSSARQTAVTENRDVYRLTFNVAGNTYALSRTDTAATLWTKSVASYGNGVALSAVNFGGGVVVSFQKRGTMTSGSATLQNGLGSTAVVTVNFTGRTYVTFDMQ